MPTSDGRGFGRTAKWIPFLAMAVLELPAGDSCGSTPTAEAPDASPTQDAGDAASPQESATNHCTSIDFGQETVVCSEPVDCDGDGGVLPPCTWAGALAFVCPLVGNSPGARYSVSTCKGDLNAWTEAGLDGSVTVYYSATTGRIVANIGGGAPGVGSCQAPCDFVVPMPATTNRPADCTPSSACDGVVEAGVADASMDGHAADAQTRDAAEDAFLE